MNTDHIADLALAAIAPHVGNVIAGIIALVILLLLASVFGSLASDKDVFEAFDPDLTRDFDAEESMRETRH